MVAVIFTLLVVAVFCFWLYLFFEEPLWAFHKWRIVRELHYNGDIDYTVEKNGFLGMPLLTSNSSKLVQNYQKKTDFILFLICILNKKGSENSTVAHGEVAPLQPL